MKSFSTPKLIFTYLVVFLLLFKVESIFATKSNNLVNYVDLSMTSTSNLANPAVGSAVTYTVKLINEGGTAATSVVVQSTLPSNFTLASAGINTSTGSFSINGNQVNWNVGNIPSSFSEYSITFTGIVTGEGVQTLKSEIFSLTETDVDSNPNNSNFSEDDIAFACVSIPYKYCSGQDIEIQVSAPSGFTNYQWYKDGQAIAGANNEIYTITSTGIFTYSASSIGAGSNCNLIQCCPITVERHPEIIYTTTLTQLDCNGSGKGSISVTASSGTGPFTYSLNGGNYQTSGLFTNLSQGNYTVNVKDANGCIASKENQIIQSGTAPNAPTIATDITNICGTQKATLTATGCTGTVTWSHNSSNLNPIQVGGGTYTATCTNSCGTSISSNSILIQSGTAPNAPTIATDITNICGTQKATLTATGCTGTVTWSHNSITQNPIQVGGGTYTATCTNSCGTSISSNSILIQSGTAPNAPTIATDITNICGTQKAMLTATGCTGTVTWNHNGSNLNPIEVGGGTYTATCTNSCGTSISSNSILIQSQPNCSVPCTDTVYKYCKDEQIEIRAEIQAGYTNYQWYKNGQAIVGANQQIYTITSTGVFTYSASSVGAGSNCDFIQCCPITVERHPEIVYTTTLTQLDCNGTGKGSISVTASSGTGPFTYSLNGGNYQSSGLFTNLSQGNYTVNVKDANGCIESKGNQIIQSGVAPNAPTIAADITNICGTQKATLTATGCTGTVTWSHNSSNLNPIQVGGGTYTATCTNSCGTSISSNSILIQSGTAPNAPTIAADITNICGTQKATITATGCAGTVTWVHNGSTQNPIEVGGGTYTATCTNSCGTSISSNSILIQSQPNCSVPCTDTVYKYCKDEQIEIRAEIQAGYTNYQWYKNGQAIAGANQQIYTITSTGVFTYSASSVGAGSNCDFIQCCPITVERHPEIVYTTTLTQLDCNGTGKGSISVTASSGTGPFTYSLNGGNYQTSGLFTNLSQGNYTVNVKDANGCIESKGNQIIQIGTAPSAPTIAADITNICGTQKAILTATGCAGTVTWNHNGSTQNPIQVGAGTYTATCTNSCGTSISSNSIQIQSGVAPNAPTIAANITNICGIQKATLTATGCAGTVTWTHNGSTQNTIQVGAGTYTATCTNSCGTSIGSNSIQIQSGLAPNAPVISADVTNICGTQKAILTATGCAGIVTWAHNGSTQNPIQVGAGTYTATCTNSCGTSISSNSIQIQSGVAPNAPVISADVTNICGTQKAVLTATGCAGTVTWVHNGSTQNPIQVGAGTYTATCTNSCGTSISSNSIQIQSGVAPNAPTIAANITNICGTQKATLTATGCAGIVTWAHNGSMQNPIQVGAGTYTATCTNSCGTSINSNSIQIQSGLAPNAPVISADVTNICGNQRAILTATGCTGIVIWAHNGSMQNPIQVGAGTYTATCTNSCGTSISSNSIQVQSGVAPNAPVIIADVTNICGTQKAILTATGCVGTVTWAHNGSTQNPIQVGAGTYTATCTNSCGTSISSNSIQIQSGVAPNAPTIAANITNICGTQNATLTATGCAGTVTWVHNGSTQNSIQVGAGTYTATCTNSCGTSISSNSIQIQSGLAPNAPTIAADITNICGIQRATLTATGCAGIVTWVHNGSTQNPIQVGAGTYTATCTNSCGTSISSNSLQIQSGTAPNAPIISADITNICGTQKATLTATGCAGTVTWTHNGSTQNPIQVGAGTYTATCSNSCGMSVSSNSIQIQSGTAPNAPIIIADITNVCGTQKATLTATGCVGTVTWTHNGSTQNPIQVGAGTYTATCTNTCGTSIICHSIQIQSGTAPSAPTISANSTNICGTQKATLTAIGCVGTVIWAHNSSTQNPIEVGAGTYTATCTNSCGTSVSSNSIQIQSGVAPTTPIISVNKTLCCDGEYATLTANLCNGSVVWNTGLEGNILNITTSGTYTAFCRNSCGEASASIDIQLQKVPSPSVPVLSSSSNSVCGNEKVTITASPCTVGNLKWSNGETSSSINVAAGVYFAYCENVCGKGNNSNTIIISTQSLPTVPTVNANKSEVCGTEKAILTATNCNGTVRWSNGQTGATQQVGVGIYTATCTTACGTSAVSNTINIIQGQIPTAPSISSNKTEVCGTEKATLSATGCAGGTITWSSNLGTGTSKEVGAGTYTATCTTSCGTSGNSSTITIGSKSAPVAPVISANKNTICGTEKATLTASGCVGGTIKWSNGASGVSIEVGVGSYTATCTTVCGLSASSNSVVISASNSSLTINGPSAPVCAGTPVVLTAVGCSSTVTWSNGMTGNSITVNLNASQTISAVCGTSTGGTTPTTCDFQVGNITVRSSGGSSGAGISTKFVLTNSSKQILQVKDTPSFTSVASGSYIVAAITYQSTISGLAVGQNLNNLVGTCKSLKELSISVCNSTVPNPCAQATGQINIQIIPAPAAPVIATNKTTVCGTEKASLTVTGCTGGTITWSNNLGTGTSKEVGAGTFTATCTTSCGTSGNSNTITIGTKPAPAAPVIASNKTEVCGTEKASLSATGCADGTITWSNNLGTGTSKEVGAGTFTATCTTSCGTSGNSNTITIGSNPAPVAPVIASNKTEVCGTEKASLTVTGCADGTITWSNNLGTGTSKEVGAGTYTATCANSCGTSGNSNTITIGTKPAPVAPVIVSNKTEVCGTETASLTVTGCTDGTITWSNNLGTGISKEVGAGSYTATCANSCGTSGNSNTITIGTKPAPAAPVIASNKTEVCGTEKASLTVTGCADGTITWSNNLGTGTSLQVGAGTYTATCANSCGTSGNSNTITIGTKPAPVAPVIATNKTEVCGTEKASLSATGCADGTITWSNNLGTGTSIEVGAGSYTATCANSCGTSGNSNTITIGTKPAPAAPVIASNKTEVCGTEKASLTVTGCADGTITWSNNLGTGTSIQVGAGTYTATCANSCGTSGNSNTITIGTKPAPVAPVIATNKTEVCGTEKASLTVTGCADGTITWSNNLGTGTSLQVGAGSYTATCANSCGTSGNSNTITIGTKPAPAAPVIASNKTEVCGTEKASLSATGCADGTITWSNNLGTGTSIQVGAGSYTATCANSCGTSGNSNVVVVTSVSAAAPIIAANKMEVCSVEDIQLTATGCESGVVIWSNGQTGKSITVRPQFSTQYTAICKIGETCFSAPSNAIDIKYINLTKPSISCVKDLICVGESVDITAENCQGQIIWSNGMTGKTINISPSISSKYTAQCKEGSCLSEASDTLCVMVGAPNAPFIACLKNSICIGETTILTAKGCVGEVIWSNGFIGNILNVSPQTSGTFAYTAVCKAVSGKCESGVSNSIKINVGANVVKPTVISELQNICPYESVNLNNAILGNPSTQGGAFEYHTENNPGSPLVPSVGMVGKGTFYLFERSKEGCYSSGSVVNVKIVSCGTDGIKIDSASGVDIELVKKANLTSVALNNYVYYTVKVTNKKAVAATNVVVRDIIPFGLEIDSLSSNAKIENGVILSKIAKLTKDETVLITYKAKVVSFGRIENKAELTSLDQLDVEQSNNSSTFVINNQNTSLELIGLSKSVGQVIKLDSNKFEVPFSLKIENMGVNTLKNIQLVDDLSKTFGDKISILEVLNVTVGDGSLKINPNYTGKAPNTTLLIDSLSSLQEGKSVVVNFKVRVDKKDAVGNEYFNSATAYAGKNREISDVSNEGIDADPDQNGSPIDNNVPTKFYLKDSSNVVGSIATSLAVIDSAKIDDLTYSVTYMAMVKNTGKIPLSGVYLTDSLNKIFPKNVSFTISSKPKVNSGSDLVANQNFDGIADYKLIIPDSSTIFEAGRTDTVRFKVELKYGTYFGPYPNSIKAHGIDSLGKYVHDISNNGLIIEPSKSDSTIFYIPKDSIDLLSNIKVFGGFSPNGDGVNDNLKIQVEGGLEIEQITIVNRWGGMVFESDNVERKLELIGWDGRPNRGILVNADSEFVPSGTYFYHIKVKGYAKPIINFLTIVK